MLKVCGLTKKLGSNIVVNNLSFEVSDGEIFGLLGPNGAGKTTTLKMLVGLLKPDKGSVYLDSIDSFKEQVAFKKKLAYIPDSANLYDNLTGREYAYFIARLWDVSKQEVQERFDELVQLFDLGDKIDNFINTYSKGMSQKISLLAALLHKPRILILDEPLTGLDPESSKCIKDYLQNYALQGNSIIFSTHILEVAEKVCQRILIINKGEAVAIGDLKQLQEISCAGNRDLEDIFLILTRKTEANLNN